MKIRTPLSRKDLTARKKDYILEVGGGHNPHQLADVIVDKYIDSNFHRSGDIKIGKNQRFMQADGENLPFEDKEFDYVICNHVLEHTENPSAFLDELSRVSKRGYIETPSLIGEYLFPKESHSWVILDIDNKLVIVNKNEIEYQSKVNFGELFLHFLPKQSIGYKILERTYPDLMTVRYEWDDKIDYTVNPSEEIKKKYFSSEWDENTIREYFPEKKTLNEFFDSINAAVDILFGHVIHRIKKTNTNSVIKNECNNVEH